MAATMRMANAPSSGNQWICRRMRCQSLALTSTEADQNDLIPRLIFVLDHLIGFPDFVLCEVLVLSSPICKCAA